MVRTLPKKNNPLVLADAAPVYEELLTRRRLGKTNLAVKPTQVGTSNATKPENLGPFEYAHLRAPLPKDLKGSEIFPSHSPQQHPETYFLMRRSKDGYVSATGMFKIAFPWAKLDEERSEREYLKTRDETSEDEIAGNVWISPVLALELASEYKMYDWVRALLDPADIVQSPSSAKKQITPPPKFDLPSIRAPEALQPASRSRSLRSASPSKKAGTPRKPRQTRAQKEASAAATSAANATLQSALDDTVSNADGEVNGDVLPSVEETKEELEEEVTTVVETKATPQSRKRIQRDDLEDLVKVDIKSTAAEGEDVQTAQTTISVEMPVSLPVAPSAEETQAMIAKAKEMVQEAVKLQEEPAESSAAAKKRKTEEAELSDEEEDEEAKTLRTKRAKVLEEKLKRERVRNRALVGVTAAFALAASIPYFF
ncbi:transcription regulator HTH, apses-type DNA-binding domain-containing protein [Aspergillus karnatakaensis]|uniref:KilA-N domain-containing protein n=1 Tax=Aspergillus karnatakaensis TaxID=1810916 RepID=UPI003CCCFD18